MSDLEKEVIDYTLKLNIICSIRNAVVIICFTVLAIVFDKWWIVFFSALFWSNVDVKNKKGEKD